MKKGTLFFIWVKSLECAVDAHFQTFSFSQLSKTRILFGIQAYYSTFFVEYHI